MVEVHCGYVIEHTCHVWQQAGHLVDELSVHTPDGVASVPVELLRAGGLLPHALKIVCALQVTHAQALQIVGTLHVAQAL